MGLALNEKKAFRLVLTDGKSVDLDLGTFKAVNFSEAEKAARKKYAGTFRRLKLRDWRVVERE